MIPTLSILLRPRHGKSVAFGVLLALCASTLLARSGRIPLSFDDRVLAQEAVERVYYEHRLWPPENPGPKPPFEAMVPRAVLEAKVEDYLGKSDALDRLRPLTGRQLQAEMDRMAEETKDPAMLRELFAALGDDPARVAECLARPIIVERLLRSAGADPAVSDLGAEAVSMDEGAFGFQLPAVRAEDGGAGPGHWESLTRSGAPQGRYAHIAVWTGAEMIVWGGSTAYDPSGLRDLASGGRYDPATDSWRPTAEGGDCPSPRLYATAVWTGREMIVWGGFSYTAGGPYRNDGGRYDPAADAWTAVSTGPGCPSRRDGHAAVWTGTEMIVWGGFNETPPYYYLNTGGRYDPETDSWSETSHASVVIWRSSPAVWTGNAMFLWGGFGVLPYGAGWGDLNTGALYDPAADAWTPVSTGPGCPAQRYGHAMVWTGSRVIVWGGKGSDGLAAGGALYDPAADTWTPMNDGGDLVALRRYPGTVWTGDRMIVWGGEYSSWEISNTGGIYDPADDSWTPTSTDPHCPSARTGFSVVWTGRSMIVWGGYPDLNTGAALFLTPAHRRPLDKP